MWGTSRSIAAHQQGGSSPLAHATTAITVAEAKAEAVKVAYAKSAHLKGERGEKAKEEAAEQKAAVEAAEQDELQELQDMFGGGARGSPVPASLYAKFRVKCEMRAKVELAQEDLAAKAREVARLRKREAVLEDALRRETGLPRPPGAPVREAWITEPGLS